MSSKQSPKRNVSEKMIKREKDNKPCNSLLSRHLKRVYPVSLQKTCSTLSLSSLSLTLSEKSTDSSLNDSQTTLDQKITLALRLIKSNERRGHPNSPRKEDLGKYIWNKKNGSDINHEEKGLRRCNWITKNSGYLWKSSHHNQAKDSRLIAHHINCMCNSMMNVGVFQFMMISNYSSCSCYLVC
ncbi:hypothetical protein Leryth_024216 [Lithospermum erythrorhizon]|nr:hypothetical protein Leryth_024216 [Lithospermum erythrorhizon]